MYEKTRKLISAVLSAWRDLETKEKVAWGGFIALIFPLIFLFCWLMLTDKGCPAGIGSNELFSGLGGIIIGFDVTFIGGFLIWLGFCANESLKEYLDKPKEERKWKPITLEDVRDRGKVFLTGILIVLGVITVLGGVFYGVAYITWIVAC